MEEIQQAIRILQDGGIVIFPTDTAFGIGCRMDNEVAVKRLFAIRKRPETKAVPVLVASLQMAQAYLQPISSEVIDKLITPFWPGGLTIVLAAQEEKVPALVRGGTATLGVRMPDHPTTLALINGIGIPIVGTSANFSDEATPYTFESLNKELIKKVDFVVSGDCYGHQASTVIDCTVKPWKILRQGKIAVNSEVRGEK